VERWTQKQPFLGVGFLGFGYRRPEDENGILVIAACIVAAIRLRGEPIQPSPKLNATIADSVQLARMVLRAIGR
jgi:hypothetical protein